MNAYTVVGPTNLHPRRFRSFDSATDSGDVDIVPSAASSSTAGRVDGSGSYRHTYAASDPHSSTSSQARLALLIVASILPRCRTIPASVRRRSTSVSSKRATCS